MIDNTFATIAIPYTSTGVVAALHDKPSIYFDPLNLLEKGEISCHSLPLLQNSQELEDWVVTLL
jgi:polysaccharide biosynthesis PFTS motif protein